MQLTCNKIFNQPFRKTAITATSLAIGSLMAGLMTATPAYAVAVNDKLEVNAKIYANFISVNGNADDTSTTPVTPGSTIDDAASGFHFNRTYFEIRGKLTKQDMVRITLDQKSADKQLFIKYAYWQHKYSDTLNIKAGQHTTPLVDYLENELWGHRYVQKTFTDYYGAQSSSDLGISAFGKVNASFDYYVSLMNGEGYTHKTDGAGYAISGRAEWHGAGAHVGVFGHSETDRSGIKGYDPTRAEIYAWWSNKILQIGGQYLTADDGDFAKTGGGKFKDGKGYNVVANIKLPALDKSSTLFVRYDSMDERNTGNNHTLTIAGVEFEAAKGVMLAVDYQSDDKGTPGSKTLDSIGANAQFKF